MRQRPLKDLLVALGTKWPSLGLLSNTFQAIPDGRVYFSDIANRANVSKFARRPMLVGNSANEGGIANINNGTFFSQFFGPGVTSEALNLVMTCASRNTARARKTAGVKVWRYRYFGDWPNSYIADGAGAYHGSEMPMVFGSTEHFRNVSDTSEEAKVVESMMSAWAAFARDPECGLGRLGWPEFHEKGE